MNQLGLAVEATKLLSGADGAVIKKRTVAGIRITDVVLRENAARRIGKLPGRYITLEGEIESGPKLSLFIEKAVRELICEKGRIFIAGLGNPLITHDSLGAGCARKIYPKSVSGTVSENGEKYSVSAMETNVAARTGIGTARLVKAAAREIRADCVIAIDALACEDPRRIGKTVQLSDTGFVLGSGAGEDKGEISRRYLKIPTVAVGVPTMTALASVTKNTKKTAGNFLVTTGDIDLVTERWAEVIAEAINSL